MLKIVKTYRTTPKLTKVHGKQKPTTKFISQAEPIKENSVEEAPEAVIIPEEVVVKKKKSSPKKKKEVEENIDVDMISGTTETVDYNNNEIETLE